MKKLLALCLLLTGCATMDGMDGFNYHVNKSAPPCATAGVGGVCHPLYPSRAELARAARLECTGYTMAKAYALAAQGVGAERMRVAVFRLGKGAHAVLVIDNDVVLDNLSDSARSFDEYFRFDPVLIPVPWRI